MTIGIAHPAADQESDALEAVSESPVVSGFSRTLQSTVVSGFSRTLQGLKPPLARFDTLTSRLRSWDLAELLSRAVVAGLFLALAFRVGVDFSRTLRVTGLLLLASESLVALFTVVRRRAIVVDRSWDARLITAISLAGPPLVRPAAAFAWLPERQATMLLACGLVVIVAAKVSLGRSFGLVPANRGVVSTGLYRAVRHPIYAGYLVSHCAFLLSHLEAWNVCVLLTSDAALLVRAVYEERTLSRDPEYVGYRSRVRWRIVPGVF